MEVACLQGLPAGHLHLVQLPVFSSKQCQLAFAPCQEAVQLQEATTCKNSSRAAGSNTYWKVDRHSMAAHLDDFSQHSIHSGGWCAFGQYHVMGPPPTSSSVTCPEEPRLSPASEFAEERMMSSRYFCRSAKLVLPSKKPPAHAIEWG